MAAVLSGAPTALSINNVPPGGLLGWSLAVSTNGKVAAGGAPATNRSGTSGTDYTGAAYVWTQSNGAWSDPVSLSTNGIPSEGQLGNSIAVSSNGQQVFVGAPDLSTYTGAVYVYTESNGSWNNTPTRNVLALPGGVTTDYSFGTALATSSDGSTLVVGAGHYASGGNSPGGLYVYTLSGGTWGNPVALSMGSIPNGADIGRNAVVSGNGTVVLASGSNGHAYVWTQSGGSWSSPVALSVPASASGQFGNAVALSDSGTVALIGDPGANSSAGLAYVYTYSGTWSATPATLSTSNSNVGSFGYSVAISPNGANAYAGAGNSTGSGIVYFSTHSGGAWSTPIALSTNSVPPGADIGTVMVQGDYGEVIMTSGESANADTGGVWAYTSPAAIDLAASASPATVAPGASLTFNLTLTNGDQPGVTPATILNDVVLTDTLPTGATYVSSNPANGSCSHSGSTVTCTLASLAPGNNSQNPWTPSITVTTPSSASVLANTLTVSSNEPLTGTTSISTNVTNDVLPTAIDGGVATSPGQAVTGALTVTPGYSGQNLSFAIQGQPTHGTVTITNTATGAFTYTPTAGFTGTDVFIFNAGDGVVTSNVAAETVTVSTTQVVPPVADNQALTAVEGHMLDGQLSATSSNGHALTYAATGLPAHGSLKVTTATGAFTYTPAPGFSGDDSFTFNANDGTSTSNTATVSITVLATSSGSSGGSSSSGKSGGGLGIASLMALLGLLAISRRFHGKPA
ncbi:MAG: cadherin-like domain-containing protein [Gammaproteobacteria bacterium]|nr:cadherin-like domain-containing protein [Gammaproteobacteria bacterium]